MTNNKMNLCTVELYVRPEARGGSTVSAAYSCVKGDFSVRACRYFKPMTCAGGVKCYGECEHFNDMTCKCRAARSAAKKRAVELVKGWIG